jgi:hypothetical protein
MKHTEGKIKRKDTTFINKNGHIMFSGWSSQTMSCEEHDANMDRGEALWNAADGMTTEEAVRYLEHGPKMEAWLRKLDAIFHHETDHVDALMAGEIRDLLAKLEAK